MIFAHIRIEEDDYDWFQGTCELPALPPLGGRVRIMDRNANMRDLRVVDVIIEGVSISMHAETPGGLKPYDGSPLSITIICSDR